MNKQQIMDGNIKIANWLDWEEIKDEIWEDKYWQIPDEISTGYNLKSSLLKFHNDSNWQWLCLEKIAKDNNCDILEAIKLIYFWNKGINSKQDLFEAILNYIKNKNENNGS